ncbi:hypothetical protein B6N60_03401 [Richelia sinica FACHB-800]|uniref:Uncharacterized protein n=1 Tax=Richelia sinica FACHB-800 TaxID=1357546 RepID=A0A975T9Q5_9NOST|nr:hypothetical protein [Richelia sinica]MBD2663507.1 hypothetical protein [Richelia sinica FACHB-800]QXE24694.1 hypothetical protein B6N60_03401 [Richelia sinica FACHB-800]
MGIKLGIKLRQKSVVAIDNYSEDRKLNDVLKTLKGDIQSDIPFLIWLLENPDSFLALPGKISLYNHDCLHILLNKGFSLEDEAFLIGFCMGNDMNTKPIHCLIFKCISQYLYPRKSRFNKNHLQSFDLGFAYGREVSFKNINNFDFSLYIDYTLAEIRELLNLH